MFYPLVDSALECSDTVVVAHHKFNQMSNGQEVYVKISLMNSPSQSGASVRLKRVYRCLGDLSSSVASLAMYV